MRFLFWQEIDIINNHGIEDRVYLPVEREAFDMKKKAFLFVILLASFLLGLPGVHKARALPDVYALSFYIFGDFYPGSTTTFTIDYGYSGISQARITGLQVSGDLGTFQSPQTFPVTLPPAGGSADLSFSAQMPTTAVPGDHSLLVSATYDDYDPSYGWVSSQTPSSYRQTFTMTQAPQSPSPQPTPNSNPTTGTGANPQPDPYSWTYVILGIVAVAVVGWLVYTKRQTLGLGTATTRQGMPSPTAIGSQSTYFCSNCGKQNPSTSKFCEFCGTPA